MNPRAIDTIRSAELIIRRLLAVRAGEQVAIVCDSYNPVHMDMVLYSPTVYLDDVCLLRKERFV